MRSIVRLVLISALACAAALHADVPTNNTWTITSSDDTGASGTVTDASIPGFSADFTVARRNVVSFAGASWSGGAQVNVLNGATGPDPGTGDSLELELTFSNVVGGAIAGVVSEYGTTTNNDLDATWTYTWAGGGSATLIDPDNQMVEADSSSFASGGTVTNATAELPAGSHTWCVTIPADAVVLDWASPTHAFAEAMAFRVQVAPATPTVDVPTLSGWGALLLAALLAAFGIARARLAS